MDSLIIDTPDFKLEQSELIIRLLVALGIGFLIGLEREHDALKQKIQSFAGIRTFVFVVLLGFSGAMIAAVFTPWIYFGILISVVLLIAIAYQVTASTGDIGSTTEFSLLLAFVLGGLSFLGFIEISLMITVVVVVLLSSKLKLQNIIGKISSEELYDFIRFVVLVLLIFPFLPNENLGPFNVLNPREIGWVIILTSGLGFVGYILMKLLGSGRGILLSGIIGGLVSSTAVTWVFTKKSKESVELSLNCAVAILAASSIMILRVLIWAFIFNRELFDQLYLAVIFVLAVALAVTFVFYFKHKKENIETEIGKSKPLDIQGALFFGLVYTLILLVVSYANEYLGEKGMLLSSAIAGLSDIDAITISVSKIAGQSLSFEIASNAILIATISNTCVKLGIGLWAGSSQLRKYLFIGYGIVFLAILFAFIYLNV
jgi:uncharacterized membrane protein (DUF4010 family)